MKVERTIVILGAVTLLSGCIHSLISRVNPDCHRPQEYQAAQQVSPLKVPEGLDTPNTQGALVIPAVAVAPPPPGPKDACLDIPPRYKAAPPNKAASPG